MTTPAVVWMRHGTCTDGHLDPAAHARPDSPLHPLGVDQVIAAATALRAAGWRPALVVTSPLPRAAASAVAAAAVFGLARVSHDPLLREWAAPTCVLGRGPQDYPADYQAWRVNRLTAVDSALPGGESLRQVRDRAAAARAHVAELADQHGTVLVVSHRVLIGCVAAIHAGSTDPTEVFNRARALPLAPAGLWRP
jgi:broad specificity phosphatase PhoE